MQPLSSEQPDTAHSSVHNSDYDDNDDDDDGGGGDNENAEATCVLRATCHCTFLGAQ